MDCTYFQRALLCATVSFAIIGAQTADAWRGPAGDPPGALGHSLSTESFDFLNYTSDTEGRVEFPVHGRIKIADNNSPVPRDRVYFNYSQFHNTLRTTVVDLPTGGVTSRGVDVNRFTVGAEKTFWDERLSMELRMPVLQSSAANLNPAFNSSMGNFGNLSLISKMLLYESDASAFAIGTAVTLPTGDDMEFRVDRDIFSVENDAIHLTPFLAYLGVPTQRIFYQAFVELDFPLVGNTIRTRNLLGGQETLGKLTNQTTVCADVSTGYWIYRDRPDLRGETGPVPILSGVAGILEFNYLTALNDADSFGGMTQSTETGYLFGNFRNRFDVALMVAGLHAELGRSSTLRLGAVVPLTDDKFFDSEFLFQLNIPY